MSRKAERILWMLIVVAIIVFGCDDGRITPIRWAGNPSYHCVGTISLQVSVTMDCYKVLAP